MAIRRFKKICPICKRTYEYCITCSEDKDKPTWMNVFDEANCRKIYYTYSADIFGHMTADEAKEQLLDCDITKKDTFNPIIRDWIDSLIEDDNDDYDLVDDDDTPKG